MVAVSVLIDFIAVVIYTILKGYKNLVFIYLFTMRSYSIFFYKYFLLLFYDFIDSFFVNIMNPRVNK